VLATEPQIIERYVKTGRVKLVFRDVLNHSERSERASEAAACAGQQGKFWEMHGLLFQEQPALWRTSNEGQLELMVSYGEKIEGLDKAAFAQCLNNRATLPQLQAADAEQRSRGITIQPVFEIGDQRLFGALPIEAFAKVIDALP
jgi:protein-disulfide isomerase